LPKAAYQNYAKSTGKDFLFGWKREKKRHKVAAAFPQAPNPRVAMPPGNGA